MRGLAYNLSSRGVEVIGFTSDPKELAAFIEDLRRILPVMRELTQAKPTEGER